MARSIKFEVLLKVKSPETRDIVVDPQTYTHKTIKDPRLNTLQVPTLTYLQGVTV
jgi:hypothetical protein